MCKHTISFEDIFVSLLQKNFYAIIHYMKNNLLLEKSKQFAISIINLCDSLSKTTSLANQLLRSGTSIGANIHEAQYAHGKADFVAKLEIALKECNESEYWLEIFFQTNKINEETYRNLINSAGTIRRILIKSCRTVKENKQL